MSIIKRFACIAAIISFHLFCFLSVAAQYETDHAVQANIIYHFTKYIDWPEYKKSDDFIIGIIGDEELYYALKKLVSQKTVGAQKIVVRYFYSSGSSFDCHILFIKDEESGSLKKIVSNTAGLPILIITESEGLALKGSCINFVIVEEHLKLEINKSAIQQRDLHIANELLSLGKLVR